MGGLGCIPLSCIPRYEERGQSSVRRLSLPITVTVMIGCCLSAVAPSHADGSPIIIEYATPSATSSPQGIVVGPDGEIWYAETAAGKIAVQRPNQSAVEFSLPNGGQPNILKVASDGIWFTDGKNAAIGRLSPASGEIVEYPVPSHAAPF